MGNFLRKRWHVISVAAWIIGLLILLVLAPSCSSQPPYSKAFGQPIHLANNRGAVDPTWEQLMTFLTTDKTDQKDYSLFSFPCGAFAEEVHNNAEAAGIKAAFVIVFLEEESEPHALNAFETVDKRLVYIDCTGGDIKSKFLYRIVPTNGGFTSEKCSPTSWDKVAYVEVGKEYGLISLKMVTSPEYSFYETYMAKVEEYNTELEAYNQEVKAYNEALGGRIFLEEPEYSKFMRWYDKLSKEASRLGELSESLGNWQWEPLGLVSKIEVYW